MILKLKDQPPERRAIIEEKIKQYQLRAHYLSNLVPPTPSNGNTPKSLLSTPSGTPKRGENINNEQIDKVQMENSKQR